MTINSIVTAYQFGQTLSLSVPLSLSLMCAYALPSQSLYFPSTEKREVTAGTTLGSLKGALKGKKEQELYGHCAFEKLDEKGFEDYVGTASWFYVNFLDTWEFPVLVCRLVAKEDAGKGKGAESAGSSTPAWASGASAVFG